MLKENLIEIRLLLKFDEEKEDKREKLVLKIFAVFIANILCDDESDRKT